jgi:hypothetical protein
MATIGRHETEVGQARFCPDCGYPAGDSRYCAACGHNLEVETDRLDPRPQTATPPPARKGRRSTGLVVAAGAALALAAIAVAGVILLTGNSSSSHQGSYKSQATAALSPVVAANQKLSAALGALDGSPSSVTAAQNAASANQSAIVAARGALGVLNTPSSAATVSQQAQQALDQDSGYVQAVSSTLKTPVGQSSSQLQTLSTGAQTALVSVNSLVPAAGDSVANTSNLLSWVSGANKEQHHKPQRQAPSNTNTAPSSSGATPAATPPPASPSLSPACGDPNISMNSATSCGFADAVFAQYAIDVQQGGASSYEVPATSPTTGGSYTDDCQLNATTQIVDCSHGSDLIQFPEWAAAVYNPGGN